MIELYKQLVISQFEAALCMLNQCVAACRPEHWEGKIANSTFREVAYHTLFFTDYYLATEATFELRPLNERGGDERGKTVSQGLDQQDTLAYLAICRQQAIDVVRGETAESLAGPAGFTRRTCSRAELHVYNIRHVQHHVGQLSAYLRRVDESLRDWQALRWVGHGWRD